MNHKMNIYVHVVLVGLHLIFVLETRSEVVRINGTDVNISSPSFPHNYPPNSNITWKMDGYHLAMINVTVDDLFLEKSEGCKFDSLKITDFAGVSLLRKPLCGNASIYKPTDLTFSIIDYGYQLRFTSDGTDEYKGFSLVSKGMVLTEDEACRHMHLQEEHRLVSSIGKQRVEYPTNLNCTWDISTLSDQQITVSFDQFNIEHSGPHCAFDRFEVWDTSNVTYPIDTILGKYCGRLYSWQLATYSYNIQLRFFSDNLCSIGGFVIHYKYELKLDQKRRDSVYRKTTQIMHTEYLSDAGIIPSTPTTWTFRTQPGFNVIFALNQSTKADIILYDGPDSSYPSKLLGDRTGVVETHWFHVIAETDKLEKTVNIGFFAQKSGMIEYPYRASYMENVAKIATFSNNKLCAYAGVAVYDRSIAFNNFKGIFCDVQENYLYNLVKQFLEDGFLLLFYWYGRYNGLISYTATYKRSVIDCTRKVSRSNIFLEQYVHQGEFYKLGVSPLNMYETNIYFEIDPNSEDCVIFNFMPFSMVDDMREVSNDLTVNVSLKFYLNSSGSLSICDSWAYQPDTQTVCSRTGSDCRYAVSETCTELESRTEGKPLVHSLQIKYGWSLQYIRVRLSKTKLRNCSFVRSRPSISWLDTFARCGYFFDVLESPFLVWSLHFADSEVSRDYFWGLKIQSYQVDQRDALTIQESHIGGDIFSATSINAPNVILRMPLKYSSMVGVSLVFIIDGNRLLVVEFDSFKLIPSKTDINWNPASVNGVCYESHCYSFQTTPSSWYSAKSVCENTCGYLVSVNSQKELAFLQNTLASNWFGNFYGNKRGLVYIGLTNLHKGRHYHWEDGHPLAVRDWYNPHKKIYNVLPYNPSPPLNPSELQPAGNISRRCVAMVPGNLGFSTNRRTVRCNDYVYSSAVYSICEYNTAQLRLDTTSNLTSEADSSTNVRCEQGWTLVNNTCFFVAYISLGLPGPIDCSELGGLLPTTSTLGNAVPLLRGIRLGYSEIQSPIRNDDEAIGYKLYSLNDIDLIRFVSITVQICENTPVDVVLACEAHQIQCQDGTCLNPDRLCYQKSDCKHSIVEENCTERDYYMCDSGESISLFNYCDFHSDCSDQSDENYCVHPNCSLNQYRCRNGQCVSEAQRCDLKPDCVDESDEIDCDIELECKGFKCPLSGCIPTVQQEDLIPDCPDNSAADESYNKTKYSALLCSNATNDIGHYRCESGHRKCYPGNKICVYDQDSYGHLKYCRSGAHLKHCANISCQDMFKCYQSFCIPFHKVCDGIKDCFDGGDESNCDDISCPGKLKCRSSSQCVSETEICDGQVHCKNDSSDEQFCDLRNFTCPVGCNCTGYNIACNGNNFETIPFLSIRINVRVLDLTGNNISMANDSLEGYSYLAQLYLSHNNIGYLPQLTFSKAPNLLILDLSGNHIKTIPPLVFLKLKQLRVLLLKGNPIHQISPGSFQGLSSVNTLDLSNMRFVSVFPHTFKGLDSLKKLYLSNCSIQQIHPGSFEVSHKLWILSLEDNGNPLEFTQLNVLQNVSTWQLNIPPRFCCYIDRYYQVYSCSPAPSVLICSEVLPNIFLKFMAWSMAILAIVGNVTVIIRRLWLKVPDVPSILILNLSISDLLIGVYLLTLAIVDVYYRDGFPLYDKVWRESVVCKTIGIFGFLSCEMSMFALLLIAVDRTKKLAYPFSAFQLTRKLAWIITLIGWSVCVLLSVMPVLLPSYFEKFYSQNAICMPFNFAKHREEGWVFTTVIFVGLNSIGMALIIALYILVYFKLRESRVKSGRRDLLEYQVARKLSVVVITDLVCMTPIIFTNIIGIMGFDINNHLAVILVSLILPINSALNPYLFTLKTLMKRQRDQKPQSSIGTSNNSI